LHFCTLKRNGASRPVNAHEALTKSASVFLVVLNHPGELPAFLHGAFVPQTSQPFGRLSGDD
jgi:hypothetical protein